MCRGVGKCQHPGVEPGWVLRVQAVKKPGLEQPLVPFPPRHTQIPRPLPGRGEEHDPHELLLLTVKMLRILPRAWSLHSSMQRALAPDAAKPAPRPSFPGSPVPAFLPQDLVFRPGPSPRAVYGTPACCSLACSPITSMGCAFPAAAGEQRGLSAPQIRPWLLP